MLNFAYMYIIGALIVLGAGIYILFVLLNKRYLNRRLKGEGKTRNMPQPLTIILSVIIAVSVAINAALICQLILTNRENDKEYDELTQSTHPRTSITVDDLTKYPHYAVFRDAILSNTLAGYTITTESDGGFECYKAFLSDEHSLIESVSLMPQYFVYIRYTDTILDSFQMQRRNLFSEDGTGYDSIGKFKPELLLIGNDLMPNMYWAIQTIVKNEPFSAETKKNWNELPVFAQSYFVITNTI